MAVGSLLSIDLALLIVWNAVDPLQRQVHNFPTKPSEDLEDDVEIQPQLEHCRANHHTVWLGKNDFFFLGKKFRACSFFFCFIKEGRK